MTGASRDGSGASRVSRGASSPVRRRRKSSKNEKAALALTFSLESPTSGANQIDPSNRETGADVISYYAQAAAHPPPHPTTCTYRSCHSRCSQIVAPQAATSHGHRVFASGRANGSRSFHRYRFHRSCSRGGHWNHPLRSDRPVPALSPGSTDLMSASGSLPASTARSARQTRRCHHSARWRPVRQHLMQQPTELTPARFDVAVRREVVGRGCCQTRPNPASLQCPEERIK